MTTARTALAGLAPGFAFASIGLPSASAQTRERHIQARSAVHECSVRASKYKDYSDELEHMYTFRTCAARHGLRGD